MMIQLDSKTRIVGTERAWELQHPRIRKGVEVWTPYKWLTSFDSALEEAVHRDIRLHPANGLSEAIEAVSDVVRRYEEIIPSEYRITQQRIKPEG